MFARYIDDLIDVALCMSVHTSVIIIVDSQSLSIFELQSTAHVQINIQATIWSTILNDE